jgi:hypothetical protein
MIIIAAFCWLIGVTYAATGIASMFQPKAMGLLREEPYLFFVTVGSAIILPAAGLIVLGLASWRRSARLAIYGLVLLVPFVLFIAYRLLR